MITHLEPDILECKVKWALGSISTSKASGGDGIPVELFQILKDAAALNMPTNGMYTHTVTHMHTDIQHTTSIILH